MIAIKPLLDAMGSSGGVAWSIFNTAFATLGLSIGGAGAAILGLCSCGLFLAIGMPLLYVLYQEFQAKNNNADTLLARRTYIKNAYLTSYIYSTLKQYELTSQTAPDEATLETIIRKDAEANLKCFPLGSAFLLDLANNTVFLKDISLNNNKNNFYTYPMAIPNQKPSSLMLLKQGFKGFVGGFATIAGGSGGFTGLLIGIGVFSGFAAFPLIGAICLGLSVVVGLAVANEVVQEAKSDYQLTQQVAGLKAVSKTLKRIWEERETDNYTKQARQQTPSKPDDVARVAEQTRSRVRSLKDQIKGYQGVFDRLPSLSDVCAPAQQLVLACI